MEREDFGWEIDSHEYKRIGSGKSASYGVSINRCVERMHWNRKRH